MNRINIKIALVLLVFIIMSGLSSCEKETELRALIVTGVEEGPIQGSYVAMRNILERSGIFTVNTAKAPWGRDLSEFIIDFSPFDLVLLNYYGYDWPEETKRNFINYVENGGGVVVSSIGNKAFHGWKEYNQIIGLQVKESDAMNTENKDPEEIEWATGSSKQFMVETSTPDHPVLKGLPARWLHEMNTNLSGSLELTENTEILATLQSKDAGSGSGARQAAFFTVSYGKGRIFNSLLGQPGQNDILSSSRECVGFITTLQRGAEWAATGKVTQDIPEEFPDEKETVKWRYYEYLDIGIISQRIMVYEIGNSTNCFVALKEFIAEDLKKGSHLDEYHDMILKVLRSGSATVEGKKILLKDFSWLATDEYRSVYEELISDDNLKEEALFALARLNE